MLSDLAPKTIEEVQKVFFEALVYNSSPLTDFSEGSVTYTIARSFAAVHQSLENHLLESQQAFYLSSAEGADLDLLVENDGLQRILGYPASGSVLITPTTDSYTLQPNTILTEPNTLLQFITLNSSPLQLTSFIDNRVTVSSTTTGIAGNLPAGTRLFIQDTIPISAIVGTHRHPSGEYCTPLSGGREEESDLLLRLRAIKYRRASRGTTITAIQTELQSDPDIEWVSVMSPVPGLIRVWVDSSVDLSAAYLKTLSLKVDQAKPAGIVSVVQQPVRQYQEFSLKLQNSLTVDHSQFSFSAREALKTYLYNLGVGVTLDTQALTSFLRSTLNTPDLQLISPVSNISVIEGSVLRTSDLDITYDIY
jgi:hypothetical protein